MTNPAGSTIDGATFSEPRIRSLTLARLWRGLIFPVRLFWGMLFCQSILGSLLIIGWTNRLARRAALKSWWSRARRTKGDRMGGFLEFLRSDASTQADVHWPNWFVRQNASWRRPAGVGRVRHVLSLAKNLVHSLYLNFRVGLASAFNVFVLTLPAGLLWLFGWYDGWNNSFNKGYEQAAVGPLIAIVGIIWFITASFYLPLAQARQAVTGNWRAFYRFRLLWQIVRLRWLSCVGLALLYFVLSIPLTVLKTSPMFWGNHPELESASNVRLIQSLNNYFFWCGLALFPAFVIVRVVAARIYAGGLLALVQTGKVSASQLEESEREILMRLDLLEVRPEPERHFLVRLAAWTGTRVGRVVSGIALAFIWLGFVAQIYISEFLNYHGALGWLNLPLVQLPWFHYLPTRLKNPFEELFLSILAVLLIVLVARILRALQSAIRLKKSRADHPTSDL